MTAKLKCPYTFPHKSRKAKVDYLTDIGGYYSRHGTYPLEFNVSVAGADLDFDDLWAMVMEERGVDYPEGTRQRALLKFCAQKVYDKTKDHIWEWAVEDAGRSLQDADTYRMLWDGDKVLDVKLGLHGRSGKHLCIEEFEGMRFHNVDPETLGETLLRQESPDGCDSVSDLPRTKWGWKWTIAGTFVDTLYRYVRQCEIDFTSTKASSEVEYHAAYRLQADAVDLYDTMFGSNPVSTDEKLADDARLILAALPNLDEATATSFTNLCIAAGIDLSEFALDN